MKRLVDFIFETGSLKRFPRMGYFLLGVDKENIAEHSWHAAIIGYVLAYQDKVDTNKVIKMLIFHDLAEVRTGDIYKLQAFYIKKDELKAVKDQMLGLPFSLEVTDLIKEFNQNKTPESRIANDADLLALLFRLKELVDSGNPQAQEWFEGNALRLQTSIGKKMYEQLKQANFQDWWKDIREKLRKEYKKNNSSA